MQVNIIFLMWLKFGDEDEFCDIYYKVCVGFLNLSFACSNEDICD